MKISEKKILIGLLAINLIIRFWRIWEPAKAFFDEKAYYVPAVKSILATGTDPNYVHPPLAKLLIATSVAVFGDNSFAWRFWPALLATLSVIALYFLAKEMFKSTLAGVFASLLLTVEFSWFVVGRLAIPEMFMDSFLLLSFTLLYFSLVKKSSRFFIGSGLFFGLALASKWSVLLLLPILAWVLWKKIPDRSILFKKALLFCGAALSVYLASYAVFLLHHNLADLATAQVKIANYHLFEVNRLTSQGVYLSQHHFRALFWAIDFYPLAAVQSGDQIKTIVFLFNPAILFTALWLSAKNLKNWLSGRLDFWLRVTTLSFLVFWLPFIFSPRLTYPYWWTPGLPFACLLVSRFLESRWRKDRYWVWGFLLASVFVFIFYYPLLTFQPVKVWYLKLLTGFVGAN